MSTRIAPDSLERALEPVLPRLLQAKELAEQLNVSTWRIHEWTRSRGLPAIRIGRNYRYAADQVSEWLRNGGEEA